jgi:HrpA-like RNA helicase
MTMPTLLQKGTISAPRWKKEITDQYKAIHLILEIVRYKMEKENPNLHDRVFLLESLVGSGKSTVFIVEAFRRFFNQNKNTPPSAAEFAEPINIDMSVYNFPDDKYTLANRKEGIPKIEKTGNIILCTQPTNILAKATPMQQIAGEQERNPDIILTENIGFSTGAFKMPPNHTNAILFTTMGTAAVMFQSKTDEEIMQKFAILAIDECHRRSLELDDGMAFLREFLQRNAGNPACPIVIPMSATFDTKKYAKYLGTYPENMITVEGGALSREIHYISEPITNVWEKAAELAIKIHKDNYDDPFTHNDILIFIPGAGEARKVIRKLNELDTDKELIIYEFDSQIANDPNSPILHQLLYSTILELREIHKNPMIRRRVICGTPVIETGITVNTLKYVIDCGLVKETAYNTTHNLNQLLLQPCSKSSLEQRGGRVGRIQYGIVYRLMPEELKSKFEDYPRPDIFTNDIARLMLIHMYASINYETANKPLTNTEFELFVKDCSELGSLRITDKTSNCQCIYSCAIEKSRIPKKSKFIKQYEIDYYPKVLLDLVSTDSYICSRNKLISLGFYGTYIGYVASKIGRLEVEASRMVLAGLAYGVNINDLVTIALFIDNGKMDYKITTMRIKREQMKKIRGGAKKKEKKKNFGESSMRAYRQDRMLESVIDKQSIDKYYFGSLELYRRHFYDDFLEPLYISRWYSQNVRKFGPNKIIEEAKKMGLDFNTIYRILENRIAVQKNLIKYGIINNYPEIDFNGENVIDQICRIKKCIYAGYKNNIAYLEPNGITYRTNTGLEIIPNDLMLTAPRPKKIIYASLFMTTSPDSLTYKPSATYISVMDGLL